MPNLKLLKVDGGLDTLKIDVEPSHQKCFRYLVWVSWIKFPFDYIPKNFEMGNLAILDMPMSNLKEVWKGTKCLEKLKELSLINSIYLTCTPDFSMLPNLEKLILSGCISLVEVHESIGRLQKLVKLDLSRCHGLKNLPINGKSKLASLETLDITHCQELNKLPKQMRDLISSNGLCSLKEVFLEGCSLTNDDIPDEFWMLYSLESLNLSWNYFESLPSGIG
ncbi:disease resistance protein RPV1-like [Macadamia integrifolia]|uniref:disease resistance protein RPV1-like n=1 Tax=Macadamia integrifolia TaxID=60698 RepID=UPI001C4FAEAF|nr:disease resistance protein RPV1-like [Macadamia integrifolia]